MNITFSDKHYFNIVCEVMRILTVDLSVRAVLIPNNYTVYLSTNIGDLKLSEHNYKLL